jgi:F420-dependent oxidoreductase-like protein
MHIGIDIQAQGGLDWGRWREILARVDGLGFASLFRSDHYFIGSQQDSLELFLSLVLAATETRSVRFGSLVTPVTFRRPVDVARMAAQIDNLSGGRLVLGLGIGWYRREHKAYGIDFPPVGERFDRLEEAVNVCRLMWGELPATFDGRYYSLKDVDCKPKPLSGRVPIIIGGTGEKRTLKIVAQYADEWCSECVSVEDYARKVAVLERHCEAVSRDPAAIRRSMVIAGDFLPSARKFLRGTAKQVLHASKIRPQQPSTPFAVQPRLGGFVVGGRQQVIDQLAKYGGLGLHEAVFRCNNIASDDEPDYLAAEIMPSVRDI